LGQLVFQTHDLGYRDQSGTWIEELTLEVSVGRGGLVLTAPGRRGRLLLRLLATLIEPTSGSIEWFGWRGPLDREHLYQLRRRIGFVHRGTRLVSNMSVEHNLTLNRIYHRNMPYDQAAGEVADLIDRMGLGAVKNLRPDNLEFSRRRLAVYAREMAKKPSLYLLEAPSQDLGANFKPVMAAVRQQCLEGRTAFIITDLAAEEAAQWVDWVLVMDMAGNHFYRIDRFDPHRHGQFAVDLDGTFSYLRTVP
jgi:ABC-type sulfate/molybdate transport systems ATPase subunit